MTAREVARLYSTAAAWVPVDRAVPPKGEDVRVLYHDGIVAVAARNEAGLYLMRGEKYQRGSVPVFWQPLEV